MCRGKRRYDTPGAAHRIVDKARDARKRGVAVRQEQRVYLCHVCKGWHVTAQPYKTPINTNEAA
jgi:hypothetical protein